MAAPRKSALRSASPAAIKAAAAAAPVAELPGQTPHPLVSPAKAAPAPAAAPASAPVADAWSASAVPPAGAEVIDTAIEQMDAVREALRQTGETTLETSRAAFERLKKAAEEASISMETAYSVAQKGIAEINAKSLAALKANSDASFEFARALTGARSLSDVLTLHSEHARKGLEALSAQTKEIASLAQKVASETAGPISSKLTKAFDPEP